MRNLPQKNRLDAEERDLKRKVVVHTLLLVVSTVLIVWVAYDVLDGNKTFVHNLERNYSEKELWDYYWTFCRGDSVQHVTLSGNKVVDCVVAKAWNATDIEELSRQETNCWFECHDLSRGMTCVAMSCVPTLIGMAFWVMAVARFAKVHDQRIKLDTKGVVYKNSIAQLSSLRHVIESVDLKRPDSEWSVKLE